MPLKFDLQQYQPNWDPISGGPFVSIQDVMNATSQMWGEVLTAMIDIIPSSASDLVAIIGQGMPELINAILPPDGSTSPLITGFENALAGNLVGEIGNQLPQWESLLITLGPQIGTSLLQQGMALAGFSGGSTILEQLITAGGGTGSTLAEFGGLFAAIGMTFDDLLGLIPGIGTGLSGSTGLGSVFTDWTGLMGSPTGLGTGAPTLPGIGGIPLLGGLLSGTTLLGSLIPSLDASKIGSGTFGIAQIPAIPASLVTGLFDTGGQILTSLLGNATTYDEILTLIPGIGTGLSGSTGLGSVFTDWLGIMGSPTGLGSGTTTLPGITGIPLLGGLLSGGSILGSLIPGLDASKIITGILGLGQIPNLPASQVTSGTFGLGLIPNLPASILTSGTLLASLIPGLDASKITSGTFGQSMITNLTTDLANLLPINIFNQRANAGSNLVISPDFSDSSITRDSGSAPAGGSAAYSTEQSHSGTQSFKIVLPNSGAGSNERWVYMLPTADPSGMISVQPGQKFYGEAWIRGNASNVAVSTQCAVAVELHDSKGVNATTSLNIATLGAPSTSAWTKLSGYVTIPAGYDQAFPYVDVYTTTPNGNAYYWDDVIIREETASQNIISQLFGGTDILGTILGSVIPSLDGSKIGSGTVASTFLPSTAWFASIPSTLLSGTIASGLIPSLDASKITTGVISETVTTIGTLRDSFLNGLFGGASGSGYTNTQAQQQAAIVAQQASAAAASVASVQDQLAQQNQAASAGSGTNFHTPFGGADGAALDANWTPHLTTSDILIRGSQGYMGVNGSLPDGTYATAYAGTAATTNDQRITVVLGDQGGSTSAPTTVVWHSASGSTNGGACLIIANDSVKFGFLSATNVFTQIGSTYTATISQGNKIDCYNVGNVFTVNVNGTPRITATDSGGLITLSNKFAAIRMSRITSYGWFGFNTVYDSFRLSSFGIADYSTSTGSTVAGWKLSRSSATTVSITVSAGAAANFPAGFFAATDYATGATVTTLATGVITIVTAGWYELACSTVATCGGTAAAKVAFPWAISVNGAQASGGIPAGVPTTIHLNAGDTVQPMLSATGDVQSSTGSQTASNGAAGQPMSCTSVQGFAHWSGKLVDV